MQHHHAHVAARLVEHGREEAVIGVSMDGLGYGDDGRLWGGEVLVCDLLGYRRVAHLEELPLPGRRRGHREAVAHGRWAGATRCSARTGSRGRRGLLRSRAAAAEPVPDEELAAVRAADRRRRERAAHDELRPPVRRGRARSPACATRSPTRARRRSSSRCCPRPARRALSVRLDGRLVEAAAARRGGAPANGSPPRPRAAARRPTAGGRASGAAVRGVVLDDLEAGAAAGAVGARLHATVAALVLEVCRRVRAATGLGVVALAGGVFQNRLLADAVRGRPGRRRLRGARRRPRAGERRRRGAGAGRGRGLYCAADAAASSTSAARPQDSPCASPFPCASPPSTAPSRPSPPRASSSAPA